MASSWALSATDLKCLKHFIVKECTWREMSRGDRYREYCAVSSLSTYFHPEPRNDDRRPIVCQMLMLKRGDIITFFLNVNGRQFGQFSLPKVRKRKIHITSMGDYYTFTSNAPLVVSSLAFIPRFTPPPSAAGNKIVDSVFLYEHCELVSEEDASSVVIDGNGDGRAVRLGGTCCWAVYRGDEVFIYAHVLVFDLFASCCERDDFPSLARVCSKSVACDDATCPFCYDHGSHVDPAGTFIGCVPDGGTCFCYAMCTTPDPIVTHRGSLPFLTDSEESSVYRLMLKDPAPKTLSVNPGDYLSLLTKEGKTLPFKNEAWHLVKLPSALSRLIILSCPVLKGLAIDYS